MNIYKDKIHIVKRTYIRYNIFNRLNILYCSVIIGYGKEKVSNNSR